MQPLLYISIFIVAIAVSGVLAFAGLALLMWKRFLNAQLKAQQEWQTQMVRDFQEQQEQTYANVAGDGETVELFMQAPEYPNQQYSFGQSYPNPYWQNPGFAYAQHPTYHPEMAMGDPNAQQYSMGHNINIEKEMRVFTAIADKIREIGYMPSQNTPESN